MLPLRSITEDKENALANLLPGKETVTKSRGLTPVRTPLQDVNIARPINNILKKAQYSQVTPFSTPAGKTPRRRSKAGNPAHLVFVDHIQGNHVGAEGMLWNSLVYKEVVALLDQKQQDCEKQLEEKDRVISHLQYKVPPPSMKNDRVLQNGTQNDVKACDYEPHELGSDWKNSANLKLFDGPLDLPMPLQSQGQPTKCLKRNLKVDSLSTGRDTLSSESNLTNDNSIYVDQITSMSTPFLNMRSPLTGLRGRLSCMEDIGSPSIALGGTTDRGCSPCPTPTPLPRKNRSLNEDEDSSPPLKTEVCRLNMSAQVSPIRGDGRTVSSATSPMRLSTLDLMNDSLNITSSSAAVVFTPVGLNEVADRSCSVFSRTSEMDDALKDVNDSSVALSTLAKEDSAENLDIQVISIAEGEPVSTVSSETCSIPKVTINPEINCQKSESVCTSTMVTPVRLKDTGQMTLGPAMVSQETWTLPPDTEDVSTMVTPARCMGNSIKPSINLNSVSSSLCDGTTMTSPVKSEPATKDCSSSESSTCMTPVKMESVDTMVTPVRTAEFCQMTSMAEVCTNETSMTPISLHCVETTMTPVQQVHCGQGTSPFASQSRETSTTPIKLTCMETMVTPVKLTSSETMVTPVKLTSSETMVTPVKLAENCVATSPIATINQETATSPMKTQSAETMMTPVKSHSTDTMVTPVKFLDSSQMTSPVTMASEETSTSPIKNMTASTMMTPVKFLDSSQMTSPVAMASEETSTSPIKNTTVSTMVTPVKVVETGQLTSPVSTKESETSTTPPRKKVHAATMTLPLCHALPRPSELDFSSINAHQLVTQLQTAAVSNTLLRQELDSLTHEKKETVSSRDYDIHSSANSQIGELLTQQAVQLSQISQLQQKLGEAEKNLEQAKLEHGQAQMKQQAIHELAFSGLQRENKELQEDLMRAYKQKKQEIAALREEHAAHDYQPHFERISKRVLEMEAQLQSFTGLSQVLDSSLQIQLDLQVALQHGFDIFKERSKELQSSQQELDKQRAEFEQRLSESTVSSQAAQSARDGLKQENQILANQLQETKQDAGRVEDLYNAAGAELKLATSQVDVLTERLEQLNAELETRRQECAGLQEESKRYKVEVAKLKETIDAQKKERVALEEERKQLLTLVAKQKTCNSSMQRQLEQKMVVEDQAMILRDQHQRLQISAKETQEFLEEERSLLSEELQDAHRSLDATRLELNRSVAETAKQKSECEQLKASVGQLKEQAIELQKELDHTKGHANFLLLQQGTEISRSLVSVSRLTDRLTSMHQVLLKKAHDWKPLVEESSKSTTDICSEGGQIMPSPARPKSFLSSILNAIEKTPVSLQASQLISSLSNEQQELDMSLCSPAVTSTFEVNEIKSIPDDEATSRGSAFKLLKGSESLIVPNQGPLNNLGKSVAVSGGSPLIDSLPKALDEDTAAEIVPRREESSLNEQVDELYNLLGNVMETMQLLDQGLSLTLKSAQHEISNLQQEVEVERETHSKYVASQNVKMADLEKELTDCKQNEIRQRRDLAALREQLGNQERFLAESKVKLEEIGDWRMGNVQSSTELQRVRQELEKRTKEFRSLEADNRLLQEILQAKVEKMRASGDQDENRQAAYIKENLVLKRECNNLHQKMLAINEEAEAQLAKAKQRMGVYKYNFEKAEQEVFKLDDLVERVVQTLKKHSEDIVSWDDCRSLLLELGVQMKASPGGTKVHPRMALNASKSTDV